MCFAEVGGHVVRVIEISDRCREIAKQAQALNLDSPLLFPGATGKPLSDMTFTKVLRDIGYSEEATPHGMRSAFKVWCAEVAMVRDEVSEAALAHAVRDKVRAAYLRTDFLHERKALMTAWAAHCTKPPRSRTHRRQAKSRQPAAPVSFSSSLALPSTKPIFKKNH